LASQVEFLVTSRYIVFTIFQPLINPKDLNMKKTLILIPVIAISFSFYAFRVFESKSAEFLQKLGIPEEFAKDCIWSSFSGMYLSHPGGTKLHQVSTSERAAMVREIASYAKGYTKSEEFKKKYLEYREGRKPDPPEKPKPMAQLKKEQKEQYQKAIKETEESMKTMSGDQKKMMKGVVDMYREQLKSLDDPNNTMYSPEMDKMQTQGYEMQLQEHKKSLATWEQENPSTPNAMVKRWLNEFLDVSKDVDFNAALIPGDGGKKYFAKTEYERKPENWKMCFRAGKETIDAGRTFAKQWLDELNKVK